MGDENFKARATLLQYLVDTTAVDFYNQYQAIQTNQASNTQISSDLRDTELGLRSELSQIQKSADAYNREFLDRRANGEGTVGTLGTRGFSTTQDFVLGGFFLSYALASLSLIVFVLYTTRQKGFMAVTLLFASVMIGIFLTFLILRYG